MKITFTIANLIKALSTVVKNGFLAIAFFCVNAKIFGRKVLGINYNFVLKKPSM